METKFASANYVPDNALTLLVGGIRYQNNGNNNVGDCLSNYKLFSYEIYEDGKLIRKFLPDASYGKWGFTDSISGKFYKITGPGATSTGTMKDVSYINNKQQFLYQTDVKTTNNTRYDVRFKINNINTAGSNCNHIFGCMSSDLKRHFAASVYNDNGTCKLKVWARKSSFNEGQNYIPTDGLNIGEVYNLKIRRTTDYVYIDCYKGEDAQLVWSYKERTDDAGWNAGEYDANSSGLWIFGDSFHDNNYTGDMTLYKFDIYEGDNLIRRYLPNKDSNSSNGPCLFEAMSYTTLKPRTRSSYSYSADMVNIVPCTEHIYSESTGTTSNGLKFKCKVCGTEYTQERNYLTLTDCRFDTGVKPTSNTNVRMGYNSPDFGSAPQFGMLFGQANPNSNFETDSYYLEHVRSGGQTYYSWYGIINGYTLQSKRDEYISFWKNKVLIYDSPEMKTPIVQYNRPDHVNNNYVGTTSLTFPTFDAVPTTASNHKFYFMEIYDENGNRLRNYVPAKKNGQYGVLDIVGQNFVAPETGTATGLVNECAEHKYMDIVLQGGEWKKRCRICDKYIDLTSEELAGGNFIRTNGTSCFYSSDKTVLVGGTEMSVFNTIIRLPVPSGTNVNVGFIPVYNSEGKLIHSYYPSRYEGKIRMYDGVTGAFEDFIGAGMSAYIPECKYHKYYKLEKDAQGFEHKHCYLCNAVGDALNTIAVESEASLKAVQPEKDSHDPSTGSGQVIYIDMWNGTKQQQHVDAKYPTLNKNNQIFEYATMQEGALKHYFLPGNFRNQAGVYDVVADTFIVIPNATVSVATEVCSHKYRTRTMSDGCVNDHCYICNFRGITGYYMDVKFDGNGATAGQMGIQRIVKAGPVKTNHFRKDLGIFEGWCMKQPNPSTGSGQVLGELIKDADSIQVTKAYPDTVTFVAQWADAFTYNGDTLLINNENTAKIDIVDDGEHGFATAKAFTGGEYSYTRTFDSGNQYGTLCLPFPIGKDEHPDFDLYVAQDVTSEKNGASLINLVKIDAVDAGVPCIYKMKDAQSAGEPVESTNAIAVTHNVSSDVAKDAGENTLSNLILHGTYKTIYIDTQTNKNVTYYAIQGDKFYRVVTSLSVRPYRAYITSNNGESAAKELYMLNFGDESTGILSVEGELVDMDKAEFYSLSGVKLSAPQKGINIVKMKNGETKKMRY